MSLRYTELIKLCIDCKRPDLVQRVINLTHQTDNDNALKWEEVEKTLSPHEISKIKEWVDSEQLTMNPTQIYEFGGTTLPGVPPTGPAARRPRRGPKQGMLSLLLLSTELTSFYAEEEHQ